MTVPFGDNPALHKSVDAPDKRANTKAHQDASKHPRDHASEIFQTILLESFAMSCASKSLPMTKMVRAKFW